MAISVNWITGEITVPKADTTLIQASPELRALDTQQFWLDLKDLEKSVDGIPWPDTQQNFPSYTIQGIVYAQAFRIIPPYFVTFEDGQYGVTLDGTNNNILEVATQNQVRLSSSNSAGLQYVGQTGLSPTESLQLAEIHGQTRRGIYVDTELVVNGNGYQQSPYNNWTSAVDDAELNGLRELWLLADATVDRQLKNFEINGIGLPALDLNGQIMDGTVIRLCNVTGTQGGTGSAILFDCQLTSVVDFAGAASLIGLVNSIAFRNGSSSILNQLVQFTINTGTLDLTLGGAATSVEISNASGEFIIANMDNAGDVVHMHMDHGDVTIAASCTAGTIHISGSAKIIDNSAGATVDLSALDTNLTFERIVENGESFEEIVRLMRADAAGKIVQQPDGSYAIRDAADSKDRIVGDDSANGGRDISSTDGT